MFRFLGRMVLFVVWFCVLPFRLLARLLMLPFKLLSLFSWVLTAVKWALIAGAAAVGVAWGIAELAKRGDSERELDRSHG